MQRNKKFLAIFTLFSWALVIFVLSTMPHSAIPKPKSFLKMIPYVDKVVHFSMYFILSFVIMMMLFIDRQRIPKYVKVIAFSIASLYGNCMELLQYLFHNGRSCDIYDACANSIGSLCGVFIFMAVYRWYWKKRL